MRLKFVLAGLLASGTAFAEGTEPDPNAAPPADGTGGGGGEMGGDMNGGNMSVDAGMTGKAGMWPRSAIARPYFRETGKITAGGDLSILSVSSTDMMGNTASLMFDFITLRGAYAVTDQISVGLNYALSLGLTDTDFALDGPITLWGGYQIKHDDKLSVAATAAFSIDTGDSDNKAIGAGLGVRYTVADKIAVFTGSPYGPGPVGGSGFGGPLGQLFGGGHLAIGINGADMAPSPITFDIPVGGMFQATPELNINVTTNLATIAINEDAGDTVIIGADFFTLNIGALYSVNEMIDVVGGFSLPDLKEIGFDAYVFSAGARAHL